jgi:hypothetical protein
LSLCQAHRGGLRLAWRDRRCAFPAGILVRSPSSFIPCLSYIKAALNRSNLTVSSTVRLYEGIAPIVLLAVVSRTNLPTFPTHQLLNPTPPRQQSFVQLLKKTLSYATNIACRCVLTSTERIVTGKPADFVYDKTCNPHRVYLGSPEDLRANLNREAVDVPGQALKGLVRIPRADPDQSRSAGAGPDVGILRPGESPGEIQQGPFISRFSVQRRAQPRAQPGFREPKRMNSWLQYRRAHNDEVAAANPGAGMGEICECRLLRSSTFQRVC